MADTALILPPCRVCGGKATGRHFGVIACEACKSFFKRNKNRDKPYKCRGKPQGKCPVKVSQAPICPYCRQQVCLKLGMSRDAIHRGRVPIDRKTELLLEARDHQMALQKEKEEEDRRQKSMIIQTKMVDENHTIQKILHQQGNMTSSEEMTAAPSLGTMDSYPDKDYVTSVTRDQVDAISNSREPEVLFENGATISGHQSETPSGKIVDTGVASDDQLWSTGNELTYGKLLSGQSELLLTASPLLIDEHIGPELHQLTDLSSSEQTSNNDDGVTINIINNNTNEDIEIHRIKHLINTATSVDATYQLYNPDELAKATLKTINFLNHRQAKEQLFGELKPLPDEVYAEIYQTTGIDLDDYRAKLYGCIQDLRPDIDMFLKYLCHLPDFENFDLKDRALLAKGGFSGWLVLSSLGVYSSDLEVWSCTYDVIFTTDDFVRYFGKVYSDAMRQTFSILHAIGVTDEELALIKLIHVYKERPHVGRMEKRETLVEYQNLLHRALTYVVETGRSPEHAQIVLSEIMKIFPSLDDMTLAFMNGVKKWQVKFPEYNFPRILLEIVGQQCEEELLVAVSVQLNIKD